MHSFSILNSRKRAIIALVHTVIFLCVAALQTALSHANAFSLHGDKVVGGIVLLAIYTIVTTVLLILLKMASHASERLYFAFAPPAQRWACCGFCWAIRRSTPDYCVFCYCRPR